MSSASLFQYCQKLIVLSEDKTQVLLAKRKGEADYDGVYSFIGGKMETTDESMHELAINARHLEAHASTDGC